MPGPIWSRRLSIIAVLLCMGLFPLAADAQIRFNLPAQPLDQALTSIGNLANLNVYFDPELVDGLRAPALNAELSADEALKRLLTDTHLHAVRVDDNTIRVVADTDQSTQATKGRHTDNHHESSPVEEVVVTGTNISGVKTPSAPLTVYTRDDINKMGIASVKEFVQRLSQNFNGGAAEDTVADVLGGNRAANNVTIGTGINLRGVGPDSTLVLLDGHRLAAGNIFGDFVDISQIPLTAIERVEIVADGASAIYGADAVGGVVNFITRKDFEGADTVARYGFGPTGLGDSREIQAGQAFGSAWGDGSASIDYEYYDRGALFASERGFTNSAHEPMMLLPDIKRNSFFGALNQSAGDSVTTFAEGNYSRSTTTYDYSSPVGFANRKAISVNTSSMMAGGRKKFANEMGAEIISSYAASQTHYGLSRLKSGAAILADHVSNGIASLDAKLDGPLIDLPGGPLRFALGSQYRREAFNSETIARVVFRPRREVVAGFAEINIPVVGPRDRSPENRLEVSVAGRVEHYSDFGSTRNPKIGVTWSPVADIRLRGTYGTSFKAPILNDLDPIPYDVVITPQFDPLTGQTVNTLLVYGGNPKLHPERARTWTLGFDARPDATEGLKGNVTYYKIRFTDRIDNISSAGIDPFSGLVNANVLGPAFIERNPPLSQVEGIINRNSELDDYTGTPGGADPASITAVIDSRQFNMSTYATHGLDYELSWTLPIFTGRVQWGIQGTHIFGFDIRATPQSPVVEILDTPYNPTRNKVRGRSVATFGSWTVAAFVNYVGRYEDNRASPSVPVSSWTTADLSASYEFASGRGVLRGASLAFSALNLTNAAPPFVKGAYAQFLYPGLNYDGANANARGRVIALSIRKSW